MIEFKVTGETWKEILIKLEGLFPETKTEKISETIENPLDSFTTQKKSSYLDEETESVESNFPVLPTPADLPTLTLDSVGVPWDPDIHTRTKSTNEDGTWRQKRQSPGFEKKKSPESGIASQPPVIPPGTVIASQPPVIPPGTGIASQSQLSTPEPLVQSLPKGFNTLEDLMNYIIKINDSRKATFEDIRIYLETLGINNVVQLPINKLAQTAATLRLKFGVKY